MKMSAPKSINDDNALEELCDTLTRNGLSDMDVLLNINGKTKDAVFFVEEFNFFVRGDDGNSLDELPIDAEGTFMYNTDILYYIKH